MVLNDEFTVTYLQAILIISLIIIFMYFIMPDKISVAVLQSQLDDCRRDIKMLQKMLFFKK